MFTQTCWLEEAEEDFQWHSRYCNAQLAIDNCIEVAVPWSDLHLDPDYELHLLTMLADDGQFKEHFPENQLIRLQTP